MKCPDCNNTKFVYSMKTIPTSHKYIAWTPQIKKSCANCGRYIKFEKQTERLIELFNTRLSSIVIPEKALGGDRENAREK